MSQLLPSLLSAKGQRSRVKKNMQLDNSPQSGARAPVHVLHWKIFVASAAGQDHSWSATSGLQVILIFRATSQHTELWGLNKKGTETKNYIFYTD